MKIWLITVGEEIPSDPGTPRLLRTGILAGRLAARGHAVTWWNSSFNHQQKIQRVSATTTLDAAQGYRIVLLHSRPYTRNISLSRILNHRDLARSFRSEVTRQPRPDVILCSYPTIELAQAAVDYAHNCAIPIAIDVRDLWPDVFQSLLPRLAHPLLSPFLSGLRAARTDIMRRATAVVGVTDSYVDWALAGIGRTRSNFDRTFHLTVDPVKPSSTELAAAERFWDERGVHASGRIVGCFPGSLAWTGDLVATIKAFRQLPASEQARLQLVFCGPDDLMGTVAAAADGTPHILGAGWRNAAEIQVLLARSGFGLLPYPSIPNFTLNMPNKVGEYMSAGLPVMTGLTGETYALLRSANVGLFYQQGDTASIKACFHRLLNASDEQFAQWRASAEAAYHTHFDATTIYTALSDYLEDLARSRPHTDTSALAGKEG